jgi:beta-glucanase (GH16 family)
MWIAAGRRTRRVIVGFSLLLSLVGASVAFAVSGAGQSDLGARAAARGRVNGPAPIAHQGYRKVFADEFNRLNRSVWDSHIWYDEAPHRSWARFQTVEHGVLHLRSSRSYSCCAGQDYSGYPMNTMTTKSSRKRFRYGYFEARMKWTKGDGAWPAFWLYSYQHAIDKSQCTTRAGEIDVMEGQGSEPRVFYGTVHSNTNGCDPSDDQNANNYQTVGPDLTARFHTYGVKWTPGRVTWYLDGHRTHSAPTYPSDDQPMFLVLQMWSGGWTREPGARTPNTIETQVDWVRVWQR